jgi:hypothetical protein
VLRREAPASRLRVRRQGSGALEAFDLVLGRAQAEVIAGSFQVDDERAQILQVARGGLLGGFPAGGFDGLRLLFVQGRACCKGSFVAPDDWP